jgi:hypothetical protein
MPNEATTYNVSFLLTNSVVVVTVEVDTTDISTDWDKIVEAAADLAYEVDGIDVSKAQADVEPAYV